MKAMIAALFLAATIARADIQAVHRVETVDEDGMAGTREEWTTAALQLREHITHSHDETTVVFDGTNGWRRDWNGFVEKLAGSDLRHEADVALVHDALIGVTGTEPRDFHPHGGDTIHVVFDPATSLP